MTGRDRAMQEVRAQSVLAETHLLCVKGLLQEGPVLFGQLHKEGCGIFLHQHRHQGMQHLLLRDS